MSDIEGVATKLHSCNFLVINFDRGYCGFYAGFFTCHEPRPAGRVRIFKISRVGSGEVRLGRVGFGQEVFELSRVGSGRVGVPLGRLDLTREG